ncbi:hypothetical protein [Aliikangiella coralliicola]|uniref:Sigma-70 family RNA polymerase sigma factor n=1 Tax=Aliikangiella coralliicola TaxID=2592383 RepID=A0A545UJ96_9GAMM|nr:hypothetical protein [Aliikangiella coralliicola]TQV89537.1 hypothetical protein FLL46_01240 [Aliikangiella coralliicola]
MSNSDDIHQELIQWGLWARTENNPGIGYPKMTSYRRLAGAPLDWEYNPNEIKQPITITDDRATQIDKVISSLDLDLKTAVYLHYHEDYNVSKIGEAMRISRHQASALITTGKRVISHLCD